MFALHLRTRLLLCLAMATIVGFAFVPADAVAQSTSLQSQQRRVGNEVERTGEIIEQVGTQVLAHDMPEPRDLYERAVVFQQSADRDLQKASESGLAVKQAEQRLRSALLQTRRAREFAVRAGRKLHESLTEAAQTRRRIEEARRWLARVQEDSAFAHKPVVAQATRMIDQAELRMREGQIRQAHRLAQNAMSLLREAVGRGSGDPGYDADRLRVGLERALEMLERLRENAGDSERGVHALARIEELLAESDVLLNSGNLAGARARLDEARQIYAQVSGVRDQSNRDRRLEAALERLDGQIARLSERMPADSAQDLKRWFERVEAERDAARRALDSDHPGRAAKHLRTAADLIGRLQRRLARDD